MTSSNWVNVATSPALNTATLHNEVTVPSTLGNSYSRLSSSNSGPSGVQITANVLHGPWEALVVNTIFTPTFNADHTFTATILSPSGVLTTDSGTWSLGLTSAIFSREPTWQFNPLTGIAAGVPLLGGRKGRTED